MKFSVVVATRNEGPQISPYLRRLREISADNPTEIILVDGASEDDTVARAREWVDEIVVLDEPNRGAQLHEGAGKATGDLLFFLRPDAQVPVQWQQTLEHFWLSRARESTAATVFSVDYGAELVPRLASRWTNFAARVRGLPSGDQGFCTTPEIYKRCGGFPPYPAMEDVGFAQRLRKIGVITVLDPVIRPAGRLLRSRGLVRYALAETWRSFRYSLGASPSDL